MSQLLTEPKSWGCSKECEQPCIPLRCLVSETSARQQADAHFLAAVQAALPANTLAITGPGQTKELTELVPGILNQLGPDSLASLRRLAESYQSMTARQAAAAAAAGGAGAGAGIPGLEGEKKEGEVGDDDEIPDLVENFDDEDEGEKKKAADLEELE